MKHSLTPIVALLVSAPAVTAQDTLLLSTGPNGQGNGRNEYPDATPDGRFVVWQTKSTNLGFVDTNNDWDIVCLDRTTGLIELISNTAGGQTGNDQSISPTISADGRFVAFQARADDLASVPRGIVIHDRATGSKQSATPWGPTLNVSAPRISSDGRYVVYRTGNTPSSADTNQAMDTYRYNRLTGDVELVSIAPGGQQANVDTDYPDVSRDGRFVSFECWNMSGSWGAQYSAHKHIWRRDMLSGELLPVSTMPDGTAANQVSSRARISGEGNWIAFETQADNLVTTGGKRQIAVKDMRTGAVELASAAADGSPASGQCGGPCFSLDGRFLAFRTPSSNLPGGGSVSSASIWVRDRVLGVSVKASLSSAATGSVSIRGSADTGAVSLTGREVIFISNGPNAVAGDTNGDYDIFLREVVGGQPVVYGLSPEQSAGCHPQIGYTGSPSASAGSGFEVTLSDSIGVQPGIFIYSKSGPSTVPLFGSYLYVRAPITRAALLFSGGTPGGCDGQFLFDFNTWIATGPDAGLLPATRVWAQFWSRDPGDMDGAHLSDALTFVIAP